MDSLTETFLPIYPGFEVVRIAFWKPYPVVVHRNKLALKIETLDETVAHFVQLVLPDSG